MDRSLLHTAFISISAVSHSHSYQFLQVRIIFLLKAGFEFAQLNNVFIQYISTFSRFCIKIGTHSGVTFS